MIRLRAGWATDVGLVRTINEDKLLVADHLFAVADGMGGAAAGEVASATAVQALEDAFVESGHATTDSLMRAAQAANRAVWDHAEANPETRGMGTTLVALAHVEDGGIAIVNVGDSRLYAFHDGQLRQVTSDHSLVAELVAEGRLSEEEAEFHPRRNIMTRALGVDPEVPIDLFRQDPEPGDRFLLCSDGLPREVKDDQIASILRRFSDPQEAARELVDEAKHRGGNDNITVVVVDVLDADADEEEKEPTGTTVLPVTPAAEAPAGPAHRRARGRLFRRKDKRREQPRPVARVVTIRVVGFFVLLMLILALAAAGIGWYARASYFVGLAGRRIMIYQGRPGGVLWFHPTVAADPSVTTSQVESRHLPDLAAGQEESSVSAARAYISRLVAEQQAAQAAAVPVTVPPSSGPSSPATTSPAPSTTVPAQRPAGPVTT